MDAVIYLFILAARYLYGLAHELYAWLWKGATTFTVLLATYVLFQVWSILLRSTEKQVETTAADTRLIVQGRLMAIEARLAAIKNKLDRIERALNKWNRD